MDTLLEVENLTKYFKTSRGLLHAVENITFSIESGKTLGIVGESGCGKSTLGRTIIHLHNRTSGKIKYSGKDISDVSSRQLKELRKNMQMIFQDPFSSLNPRMSVGQIIAEPLKIYKICKSNNELVKKVEQLMDTVGLARRFVDSYPHEMDGGRRQRVGIARAISLRPKLIICDEPISALDVSIQAQILNLMQDLQEEHNLTYMFITHNISVVRHVSNDILVMYLGQMVEKASSEDMFTYRLHPYTKALLSAVPIPKIHQIQKRQLLKGEISSPIDPGEGCRFAPRCLYSKDICLSQNPITEEVLPNHFVSCHYVREINNI